MFENGDGSVENPYQITTPTQLSEIRNNLDAHYILMNNLDLQEFANNEVFSPCATPDIQDLVDSFTPILMSTGWEPIGTQQNPFRGSLDGNNKTITNLTFARENYSFNGIFSVIESAEIKDLNLTNSNISGGYATGCLIGLQKGLNILLNINCDVNIVGKSI